MKILLAILFFTIIIVASGVSLLRWGQGESIETWESKNEATFRIRVLKYPEKGEIFIPGAYYVFQSAPVSSKEWTEIMTFKHDDPVNIPHDQVRFVSDKIGYVFMGWKYAVTTNGGATWSIWDATQNLSGWECCHYKLIKDVQIEADGGGIMTLNSDARPHGRAKLHTKDYGQHWSEER